MLYQQCDVLDCVDLSYKVRHQTCFWCFVAFVVELPLHLPQQSTAAGAPAVCSLQQTTHLVRLWWTRSIAGCARMACRIQQLAVACLLQMCSCVGLMTSSHSVYAYGQVPLVRLQVHNEQQTAADRHRNLLCAFS